MAIYSIIKGTGSYIPTKHVKNEDFLRGVITEFWENYGGKTYDGLNPKLAIFGSKIDEIINEVSTMRKEFGQFND